MPRDADVHKREADLELGSNVSLAGILLGLEDVAEDLARDVQSEALE